MKANELRLGNYIQFNDTPIANGIYSVMAIKDDLIVAENGGAAYLNEVEPIPLTEEWLTRFGFELPAHTWIGDKFHLTEYGTGSKHPNGGVWVVAMNKNNAIISELKYVHSLQNLHFALTGEELTLIDED